MRTDAAVAEGGTQTPSFLMGPALSAVVNEPGHGGPLEWAGVMGETFMSPSSWETWSCSAAQPQPEPEPKSDPCASPEQKVSSDFADLPQYEDFGSPRLRSSRTKMKVQGKADTASPFPFLVQNSWQE